MYVCPTRIGSRTRRTPPESWKTVPNRLASSADRRPGRDQVIVDECLDPHLLLDPLALVGGALRHELWKLKRTRRVVDLTEPE